MKKKNCKREIRVENRSFAAWALKDSFHDIYLMQEILNMKRLSWYSLKGVSRQTYRSFFGR